MKLRTLYHQDWRALGLRRSWLVGLGVIFGTLATLTWVRHRIRKSSERSVRARQMSASPKDEYIPALRYGWLTPLYDFTQRWIFREAIFKAEMVKRAGIRPGNRVLDLGCGTGTLTILIKKTNPEAEVIGLDGDAEVLSIARSKAAKAEQDITFEQGMAFQLPYPDHSFDRVLSSLMFHHLTREKKYESMKEVHRVLRAGGEFHLADLGQQYGLLYLIGLILGGLEEGVDNVRGLLPQMLREVEFEQVEEAARFATPYGVVSLYKGKKPRQVEL